MSKDKSLFFAGLVVIYIFTLIIGALSYVVWEIISG